MCHPQPWSPASGNIHFKLVPQVRLELTIPKAGHFKCPVYTVPPLRLYVLCSKCISLWLTAHNSLSTLGLIPHPFDLRPNPDWTWDRECFSPARQFIQPLNGAPGETWTLTHKAPDSKSGLSTVPTPGHLIIDAIQPFALQLPITQSPCTASNLI